MDESTHEIGRPFAKKVFFLYPPSVVEDQLLMVLLHAEFEVATVSDHTKIPALLERYHSSILFVNLEAGMKETDWEPWIRNLVQANAVYDVRIGIMTYNENTALAKKYLMDLGLPCGWVVLKLGLAESARIVLHALEANEARGGRRHVRVKCPPGRASITISSNTGMVTGTVVDISSVGFACIPETAFPQDAKLDDIQLVLWGLVIMAGGVIAGLRQVAEGRTLHVVLFKDLIDRPNLGKVFTFIRKALQAEADGGAS